MSTAVLEFGNETTKGKSKMSEIVKCEVCGGLFNQSYLVSHKRLAHREKTANGAPVTGEPGAIDKILSLYEQLSNQGQKDLLDRLITMREKGR